MRLSGDDTVRLAADMIAFIQRLQGLGRTGRVETDHSFYLLSRLDASTMPKANRACWRS